MYKAVNEKELMCIEPSYVPSTILYSLLHFLEQEYTDNGTLLPQFTF